MTRASDCLLCRGEAGDPELNVVEVWSDELWRLVTVREGMVAGFCFLEPRRHIPHITELDGDEADTLGAVLARTTRAVKTATGAELVFVFVFGGGIAHLHFHLAPYHPDGPLTTKMVKGEVTVETLPSGAEVMRSAEFPPRSAAEMEAAADAIRRLLATAQG